MVKSLKGIKTEKNLLAAFASETQVRNRYTNFASVAWKEGYEQIATKNNLVAATIGENLVNWHCPNYGYVFEGKEVPLECPACKHPQFFYKVLAENY